MRSTEPVRDEDTARGGVPRALERRPVISDGLVATLLLPPPSERRGPAVVVLGGARGGLDEHGAGALAEAGFVALALAYFGAESLPGALVEIPLEYVGRAIAWLRAQPEVGGRRVGLVGRSKGGELALQAAATYREHISAVVGYTPSPVVWQGLPADRRGWREPPRSSWTLNGNPLPFLPLAKPRASDLPRIVLSMLAGKLALRPAYERALDDDEAREHATIPLEHIAGPVLLISGSDDQMWPATALCELAMTRLARRKHPSADRHLTYDGAGHLLALPGSRPPDTGRFAVGGSPAADGHASDDAWPHVQDFLKHNA